MAAPDENADIDHTKGAGESVTFTEPGPIGMTIVKRASKDDGKDYMVIDKIAPGKQADKMPQLRVGLLLKSVNGQNVEHLSVQDVLQLMKVRPVSCEFVYRTDDTKDDPSGGYLYGNARQGAMSLGFAAKLHKKAQHAQGVVSMSHEMVDHTEQDEIIDAELSEPGPLGVRLGDHTSAIDGATYLVITSIKPGSQAARLAPQVTEGLLLKAVNGTDVVNWATNDVMGLMAARPLHLRFVRLSGGGGGGGGGGADPAVLMKLQLELSQTKEHLHTVEADGSRMLEHMYHLEDALERSKADNKQLSADLEAASNTVRQLDEGHADLLRTLHQTQSQLADEKEAKERVEYENIELRKRLALLADHFETTKSQLGEQVERVTHAFEMEKEAHSHTRGELEYTKSELDRAITEHGAAIASEKFHRSQYELASKLRSQSIAQAASRHATSVSGTPRGLAGGGSFAGAAAGVHASARMTGGARMPAGGTPRAPSYGQI
jgi:hypothetical protein